MTNFERWQLYCKDLPAPQSFVDFGFYYIIAAALQRRVWVSGSHMPVFASMYIIPTGPPGVGKGLVIKTATRLLTFWKLHKNQNIHSVDDLMRIASEYKSIAGDKVNSVNAADKTIHITPQQFFTDTKSQRDPKKITDEPLLIPMAPESTTWEALVKAMADSYSGGIIPAGPNRGKVYTYCSLAFCLEELSSLFKKKQEDVSKFLLNAYDCGDYTYETISRKKDRIKNCCLNLFAGTTPSFMQESFDDRIIGDGLTSRIIYVFEFANRFNEAFIPELTQEQKIAESELLIHIRELTRLYGQVQFEKAAFDYIREWWREFPRSPRPNNSPKLAPYYARKQLHLMKMSLAIHFGEHADLKLMTISLQTVKKAMKVLDENEKKMHLALNFKSQNPYSEPSKKILEYLKMKGTTIHFTELQSTFWEDLRRSELEEVLNAMIGMGKIETEKNALNGEIKGYRLIKSKGLAP